MKKLDNGSPFNSKKFEVYAAEEGFKICGFHYLWNYVWLKVNGDVERKQSRREQELRKWKEQMWSKQLSKPVCSYKTAPHSGTGYNPNKLMFGRELRGKLPNLSDIRN